MMKKMTTALFGLGLIVLIAGIIGTTFGTDIIAKEDINQSFNTTSGMNRLNDDSYIGMMGNHENNYRDEDYSNREKQDVEVLEEKVNKYITNIDGNLEIADVFIFSDSDYYYSIVEKDTGMGAMELLVNPYTGVVHQEYGPNMIWNLKYGMMGNDNSAGNGGMMGNSNTAGHNGMMGNQSESGHYDVTNYQRDTDIKANELSIDEVFSKGNDFLSRQTGDGSLSDSYHEFYGYFTFHIENEGKPSGMLSVNAFTGEVWFHDWHGQLLEIIGNHKENIN